MLRMLRMNTVARTCAFSFGIVLTFASTVRADSGTTQQLGSGTGTSQQDPAISGTGVVWTSYDGRQFDIYYQDLSVAGTTPQNLTAKLTGDQFLDDIYNGSVVFTNTGTGAVASDILVVDT